MGSWFIAVEGSGEHHNDGDVEDADRMAREFVEDLLRAGHTIARATFTHGGLDVVYDDSRPNRLLE